MKKITTLALAALLAVSMTALAGDTKDTKSCDKAKACCKNKDAKECKLDAKECKDANCEQHAKHEKHDHDKKSE